MEGRNIRWINVQMWSAKHRIIQLYQCKEWIGAKTEHLYDHHSNKGYQNFSGSQRWARSIAWRMYCGFVIMTPLLAICASLCHFLEWRTTSLEVLLELKFFVHVVLSNLLKRIKFVMQKMTMGLLQSKDNRWQLAKDSIHFSSQVLQQENQMHRWQIGIFSRSRYLAADDVQMTDFQMFV